MNPDEIRQLAQKERLRQKDKKHKKRKDDFPKVQGFQPVSADSWSVFSKIYPGKLNVLVWLFGILTLGTTLLFLYWENKELWMLQGGLGLVALVGLRLILYYILKILEFGKYRKWRRNLPFTVNGWDILGKKEKYPSYTQWDLKVSLTVKLKSNPSDEVKELIRDALFIFISKANKDFYEPASVQAGFVGDVRKKWDFTDSFEVTGSANASVLGEIYLCISKLLRSIHLSYPVIESVSLHYSNEIYTVDLPDSD
jgi:hypothetical protein